MAKDKFYKWTVEFAVEETWVADGFEMTEERALEMLANDLGWANVDTELKAKIIKSPTPKSIRKAQGYQE